MTISNSLYDKMTTYNIDNDNDTNDYDSSDNKQPTI